MTNEVKNWFQKAQKEGLSKIGSAFQDIVDGNILIRKFFREQYLLIFLLAALAILYTGNRYAYEKSMRQKRELEISLVDKQYEYLSIHAELIKKSRFSEIEDLVKDKIPELKLSKKSIIIIK